MTRLSFALLLCSILSVSSFTISQTSDRPTALLATRRDLLAQGAAVVGASLVVSSIPAYADVSDGNTLPAGAAQFSRLLRVKSDLKVSPRSFFTSTRQPGRVRSLSYCWSSFQNVEKRVKEQVSEMDTKEW